MSRFKTGDIVEYWKGLRRGAPSGEAQISSMGMVDGRPVAYLVGVSGGVALTHLNPKQEVRP